MILGWKDAVVLFDPHLHSGLGRANNFYLLDKKNVGRFEQNGRIPLTTTTTKFHEKSRASGTGREQIKIVSLYDVQCGGGLRSGEPWGGGPAPRLFGTTQNTFRSHFLYYPQKIYRLCWVDGDSRLPNHPIKNQKRSLKGGM